MVGVREFTLDLVIINPGHSHKDPFGVFKVYGKVKVSCTPDEGRLRE
jgi:hypothetical protein